ncbi:TIGR04222 domain-containing membrane protein [Spirillospora sp. NBC_00431]
MDEFWGPALALLAGHILVGIVLVAMLWSARAKARRGHPPIRELHAYEVAYLHGGARHAIAVSIAALRLDGAVDVSADARLIATGQSAAGPRTAGTPLNAAVLGAIAGDRGATLAEITAEQGVRAAVDQLRDGLVPQGMVVSREGLRRLRNLLFVLGPWSLAGFIGFIAAGAFGGFPGVLVAVVPVLGLAGAGSAAYGTCPERTDEGDRIVEGLKTSSPHLDPSNTSSYAELGTPMVLMGVALFGTAALMATDPEFAQTVGLGRYLELTGVAGTSGGYVGASCSSTASVCSSSSWAGGGEAGCGGGGCGGGCGGGG